MIHAWNCSLCDQNFHYFNPSVLTKRRNVILDIIRIKDSSLIKPNLESKLNTVCFNCFKFLSVDVDTLVFKIKMDLL